MNRRGVVFTLLSVLIALSFFSLLTNYKLFVSELALGTSQDVGIAETFLYAGSHVQKIADVDVRLTFNESHVSVNFSDKAPRSSVYNNSLKAYRDFLKNKMNYSYMIDFNESVPVSEPSFDVAGMNAQYNYSNFTKGNVSFLARSGEANYIKRYELRIAPLESGVTVNDIVATTTSGNLSVFITAGSQSRTDSISRTSSSLYTIRFSNGKTVNITAGRVYDKNASVRIDPFDKAWINTTVIAKTNELP